MFADKADLSPSSANLQQGLEMERVYPLCELCVSVPSDSGSPSSCPRTPGC